MGTYEKPKPCPNCGQSDADKINFTWWGGAIGPRIFNHVKCNYCSTKYNAKSGDSNTTNIIIYTVVLVIIAFALVFMFQGG
ncbi:MAG: hypothetical protein Q9P44_09700 [Anaerolineae bacterium]|nr:hypothetical protein [Anaerolineae bacterium]